MKPIKARKKPVVIDAIQIGSNVDEIIEFTNGNIKIQADPIEHNNQGICIDVKINYYINTLEGTMKAERGDYVIKGVSGEFYSCKPNIFEATYDIIE